MSVAAVDRTESNAEPKSLPAPAPWSCALGSVVFGAGAAGFAATAPQWLAMLHGREGVAAGLSWVALLLGCLAALAAGSLASPRARAALAMGLVLSAVLGCAVGGLSPRSAWAGSSALLLVVPTMAMAAFWVTTQRHTPRLRAPLLATGLGAACALGLSPLVAASLGFYAVLCLSGCLLCLAAMASGARASSVEMGTSAANSPPLHALAAALLLGAVLPDAGLSIGPLLALLVALALPARWVGAPLVLAACVVAATSAIGPYLGDWARVPLLAAVALGCAGAAVLPSHGSSLPKFIAAAGIGFGVKSGIAEVADAAAAVTAVAAIAAFALRSASGFAVVVAVVLALFSGLQATWQRPVFAAEHERMLAVANDCRVHFRERDQALLLLRRGQLVDLAGPDRRHADLLAGLARAALSDGARLVIVGSGTRRLLSALDLAPGIQARLVDSAALSRDLESALLQDGPVAAVQREIAPRGSEWIGGRRSYLWAQPAGAAAMVLAAEPLLAANATRVSVEEHQAMRHASGGGLVVQTFLLDATPPRQLAAALAAARAVHAQAQVFLVGTVGVIVGAGPEFDFATMAQGMDGLPLALRWRLHAAGIAGSIDWRLAALGPLPEGAVALHDEELLAQAPSEDGSVPGGTAEHGNTAANLAVLRTAYGDALKTGSVACARLDLWAADPAVRGAAMRRLEPEVLAQPDSVLLRAELWRSRVAKVEADLANCDPNDAKAVAALAALVVRFAHIGCPSPALQAALALPDVRGERVREPHRAAELALALDPGYAKSAPPLLAPIVAEAAPWSPLLDLHRLPRGAALVARCEGDDALAVALRCRFPSACAEALIAAWAEGPLPAARLAVLRELADPFVLTSAASALAARGARAEVLRAWPVDLPVPQGVAELAQGSALERSQLMEALAYHQDPRAIDLLAAGLLDAERSVRAAAGAALVRVAQGKIAFDPDWSQSARQDAAAKLRALHNRAP